MKDEVKAAHSALQNIKFDMSMDFEMSLLRVKFVRNAHDAGKTTYVGPPYFSQAEKQPLSPETYVALLWRARCNLWNIGPEWQEKYGFITTVNKLLKYPQFQMKDIFDRENVLIEVLPADREAIARSLIFVTLDGETILPGRVAGVVLRSLAQKKDGRTMVPVRYITQMLGATVTFDEATKQIDMLRAADHVVMTIGSRSVTHNGVVSQMDAAPYVQNGSTYIPVRDIAEFFGQSVTWEPERQHVRITEDYQAVGNSNLEAWAMPMGLLRDQINAANLSSVLEYPDKLTQVFGGFPRYQPLEQRYRGERIYVADYAREGLSDGWGITDRAGLIDTVCSMTVAGHNDNFLRDVAFINSLTSAEYQSILNNATGMDKYMFPYTKQLGQKWGSKGILCWDLFRMSNLVQWGYAGGYVTYPEALALLEPAAKLLRENFSSWDQAYENYLDGYNWWARNDVLGKDVWQTERGKLYTQLKKDPATAQLFDDSLFTKEVIGVPDLTARQLWNEVNAS